MEICRLCLHNNDLTVIEDELLISEIKDCVSIQISESDGLSNLICQTCVKQIKNFTYFKLVCLQSNETLKKRKHLEEIAHEEEEVIYEKSPSQRNQKVLSPHCSKTLQRIRYKNLHLNKQTDWYKCPKCLLKFGSKTNLNRHLVTVHYKLKLHTCITCDKKFATKTGLNVHLKSHNDTRSYKCELCEYSGKTAAALNAHQAVHSQEERVCEICSKTFKSRRNLAYHKRRTHYKKDKFQCDSCGLKFPDKSTLTVHLRIHLGIRPYACELCKKSFVRSDGLKDHLEIHKKRIPIECNNCDKTFLTKRGLSKHNCGKVAPLISKASN